MFGAFLFMPQYLQWCTVSPRLQRASVGAWRSRSSSGRCHALSRFATFARHMRWPLVSWSRHPRSPCSLDRAATASRLRGRDRDHVTRTLPFFHLTTDRSRSAPPGAPGCSALSETSAEFGGHSASPFTEASRRSLSADADAALPSGLSPDSAQHRARRWVWRSLPLLSCRATSPRADRCRARGVHARIASDGRDQRHRLDPAGNLCRAKVRHVRPARASSADLADEPSSPPAMAGTSEINSLTRIVGSTSRYMDERLERLGRSTALIVI